MDASGRIIKLPYANHQSLEKIRSYGGDRGSVEMFSGNPFNRHSLSMRAFTQFVCKYARSKKCNKIFIRTSLTVSAKTSRHGLFGSRAFAYLRSSFGLASPSMPLLCRIQRAFAADCSRADDIFFTEKNKFRLRGRLGS